MKTFTLPESLLIKPGQRDAQVAAANVDKLGGLLAAAAELQSEIATIKASLKRYADKSGNAEIDGQLFRCTISTATRTTIDGRGLCEWLDVIPPEEFTKTSTSTSVRCVARKS